MKTGSQIMVGFIANVKTENANKNEKFLFPDKISFKIMSEKVMTGKSGLGDCAKINKTGTKIN
jgi:hypothetical protein